MYVTPKRLRHAGLGMDISALTDVELRSLLVRAANRVDAYCTVPMLPQRFTFAGGTMTGERHGWTDSRARRIYLSAHPIRSVIGVRVYATNNLFIDFETNDFFVHYAEGYVELVNFAITKAGIWGEANVPQLGLSQPVSEIDYVYGYSYAVIDEEASPLPSGETALAYQEYLAENGFWDDSVPTVKVNGTTVTTGFTLDKSTGLVRFDSPQASTAAVSLSYTYTIPPEIVEGNNLILRQDLGERALVAKGMTGIESIEIEEVRVRRIGSRSGAEKGLDVPEEAKGFLDGYKFWTAR